MLSMILFLESLGGGELLVVLLFILIFFGSNKIPDLARGLGKGMREMKDAMQGVQSEIRQTINEAERTVNDGLPDDRGPVKNDYPEKKEATETPEKDWSRCTIWNGNGNFF